MVNRRSSVKAIPLMGEIAGQFSENIPLWILQCRSKDGNLRCFFSLHDHSRLLPTRFWRNDEQK